MEQLNPTYRTDVLHAYVCESVDEVRALRVEWVSVITKNGAMMPWQACRRFSIGPNFRREVLLREVPP